LNAPNVIGQYCFHRGCNANTRMHAAEIVIREMQSNTSTQMGKFLAVPQRQASETAHLLSHGQVLPWLVLSPATSSRRMMVLRLSPVRRSVLRMEQPSRRQCRARIAAWDSPSSCPASVWCGVRRRSYCKTGNASVNAALTEVPKFLAGLVLASGAGHGVSPLAFCEETRQNRFSRSMAWVTPRCGLIPASASTEAGMFSQELLSWWRPRHRFSTSCFLLPRSASNTARFVFKAKVKSF